MNIKAFFLILILSAVSTVSLYSQDFDIGSFLSAEKLEKINSQKIAFLTKEMNLSVVESQSFWPVYNEYQQKKSKLSGQKTELLKKILKESKDMSGKDALATSDELVNINVEEANLQQEYHTKFKQVLPPEKVLRYYIAESKFKIELLKEIRNRMGKGNKHPEE